jgi:hypothetical protein
LDTTIRPWPVKAYTTGVGALNFPLHDTMLSLSNEPKCCVKTFFDWLEASGSIGISTCRQIK